MDTWGTGSRARQLARRWHAVSQPLALGRPLAGNGGNTASGSAAVQESILDFFEGPTGLNSSAQRRGIRRLTLTIFVFEADLFPQRPSCQETPAYGAVSKRDSANGPGRTFQVSHRATKAASE